MLDAALALAFPPKDLVRSGAARASSDETFCIYCQKEYSTPNSLRWHVLRKHPGTYRAWSYETE